MPGSTLMDKSKASATGSAVSTQRLEVVNFGLDKLWLKSGDHQLRLVVYPIVYRVSYIPGGAGFQPSTVVHIFVLYLYFRTLRLVGCIKSILLVDVKPVYFSIYQYQSNTTPRAEAQRAS